MIVGDIHGQVHDLVHMIEKAGDPADINYLFLGDYVDRGIYGMEVMFILLAIKVSLLFLVLVIFFRFRIPKK